MYTKEPNSIRCTECEAKVMDALDGALTPAEQTVFDQHIAGCIECSRMVADAQRGAAWLEMLKSPRPEPSADLLQRILAQTSGTQMPALLPSRQLTQPTLAPALGNTIPFPRRAVLSIPLSSRMLQPRLAMTAAMAFFSVALTMNLIGFHPTQLKASELRPSSLKRDYYQATAHAAQYYDNLRVVSQLESRLQELKQTNDSGSTPGGANDTKPAPSDTPQKQQQPAPGNGTSRRNLPTNTLQISLNRTRSTRQGVSA